MATGSGAGLVRVSSTILSVSAGAAAVTSPLTAYGDIGVNDSGPVLTEARDFCKWTFMLIGGGAGYAVTMYGTIDPVAYRAWIASFNPGQYPGGVPVVPPSSWVVLPGPSEQTGTGGVGNPMTETAPTFQFSGAIVAVRAVLSAAGTGGTCSVVAEATP